MARFYIVGARKPGQTGHHLAIYNRRKRRVRYLIYAEEIGVIFKQAFRGVVTFNLSDYISYDVNDLSAEERGKFRLVSIEGYPIAEQVASSIAASFSPRQRGGLTEAYACTDWRGEMARAA
jgi:hypothetical protein